MIVRVVGAFLILCGSFGYGYSLMEEKLYQIRQLEVQRKIIIMMQGEIMHFQRDFPDLCRMIAKKCAEPYAAFLKKVAEQMNEWNGETLSEIWKHQADRTFQKQKKLSCIETFYQLTDNMNCQESMMQIQVIQFAQESIEEQLKNKKQDYLKKRRLIMWLSAICGFICIILLL